MCVRDTVAAGIITNEMLRYFLARMHAFLLEIGIKHTRVRFRKHMANEMAHYAADCWDTRLRTRWGGPSASGVWTGRRVI
jgi:glycyl-tRNA synthetase